MEGTTEVGVFYDDTVSTSNVLDNTTATVHEISTLYNPPLDWVDFTEITILGLLALIGTPANILVFLVQFRLTDKATTDFMIAGLALVDLINAIIVLPIQMIFSALKSAVLSNAYCRVFSFSARFAGLASGAFIGALAIDRYILTCHPFNTVYNKRIAKYVCCIIPVVLALLISPVLLFLDALPEQFACLFRTDLQIIMTMISMGTLLVIAVDFVAIIFCYSNIAIMLRKRSMARLKKNTVVEKEAIISTTSTLCSSDTTSKSTTDTVNKPMINPIQSPNLDHTTPSSPLEREHSHTVHTTADREEIHDKLTDTSNVMCIGGPSDGNIANPDIVECELDEDNVLDQDESVKNLTPGSNEGYQHTDAKDISNAVLNIKSSESSKKLESMLKREVNEPPNINDSAKHQKQKEHTMNKTTVLLFLISLVFMISWSLAVLLILLDDTLSRVLKQLLHLGRKMNVVTNPFLFILMSTKFRNNLRLMFKR